MTTVIERFDKISYTDLSPESEWTRLGRGSFGCVYTGEYLGLEVAIKEVLPSGDYDVDKYFRRECKIMAEARHPNIVQYLGLCLAPQSATASYDRIPPSNRQRILIISEFLPRGNLRQYIDDRHLPFPWRLRLSFAIDVARAVTYLHSRQCLHRDLKGENLLCTANERLKVCDFGFARLAAKNDDEMRRMCYCGTDGYMSPEILLGDEFGLPTDSECRSSLILARLCLTNVCAVHFIVFSLGVIFVEILCRTLVDGKVFQRSIPTFGIDAKEIKERASPGHPPAFVQLTLDCIDIDPLRRPTAIDVLNRLRHIEQQVIASEAGGVATIRASGMGSLNVGSLSFSGSLKKGSKTVQMGLRAKDSLALSRPNGPPRLASWDGQVKVPQSNTTSTHRIQGSSVLRGSAARAMIPSDESDSDDADDVDLLALAEFSVEPTSVPQPVKNENVVVVQEIEGHDEDDDSDYSTTVLKRSWRGQVGSSIMEGNEPQWSTITVKAPVTVQSPGIGNTQSSQICVIGHERITSDSSSIGSLPGSWIDQHRAQLASGPLATKGTGLRNELDYVPEIGSELSIANATVNLPSIIETPPARRLEENEEEESRDVFHSTILGSTEDFAQACSSDIVDQNVVPLAANLHRFSLVKPGFQKLLSSLLYGPPNPEPVKNAGAGISKRLGFKGSNAVTKTSSVMDDSDKCIYCEKKLGYFGWKAYLECDDCGIKCHIKCSDEIDANCSHSTTADETQDSPTSPVAATPSIAARMRAKRNSAASNPSKLMKKRPNSIGNKAAIKSSSVPA